MSSTQLAQHHWPYGTVRIRAIPGFANGLAVPSIQIFLALADSRCEAVSAAQLGLGNLTAAMELALSVTGDREFPATPEAHLREWIRRILPALGKRAPILGQEVAGSPQWRYRPDLFRKASQPLGGYVLNWPTHFPELLGQILGRSLSQWSVLARATNEGQLAECKESVKAHWQSLESVLQKILPGGLNAANLLAASTRLHLPTFWVDRDVLQVGHGRRARWLRSTLTDATSSLGVMVARDKTRTSRLLRQAGIPTPRHVEVSDVSAAVRAAGQIGWPVVVKPADQDRGEGARANLQTVKAVSAAFAHANAISRRVLVEQHIAGREYRMTVVNGKLFWAHERVPAEVVGDGKRSVQSLIELENARRVFALRSNPNGAKPIQLTPDDMVFIEESGWTIEAIPAAGQAVRLQRVPVANTGGSGKAYFDTVHPDNRVLAERAAQLLRLDIAGVDLIMTDITRSWREVGGAVTEVNAIPQVSALTDPTLFRRLLQQVIRHSGRVPVLYVVADGVAPGWLAGVVRRLADAGLRIGVSTDEGLQLGEDWIRGPRTSLWDDVRAMQIDPSVGAIVVVGNGEGFARTGLPFDRIDALVVTTVQPSVLPLLLPYAPGFKVIVGDTLGQRHVSLLQVVGDDWTMWAAETAPAQIKQLADVMLRAESAYAKTADAVIDQAATNQYREGGAVGE